MARRTWIGISSAALAAVVTGALTTPLWAAAPVVVPAPSTRTPAAAVDAARGSGLTGVTARDRARCRGRSTDAVPVSTDVPPAGELSQTVTVTVPRTAIVHLGTDGRVVAATTNTGCPPRPSDDIWVWRAGAEDLEPGSWATFRAQRWTGDFSQPGVVVAQRGD